MSALLYGRINNPDWKIPWHDTAALAAFFGLEASFEYGRLEPLANLFLLTRVYMCLADEKVKETQKRADNALQMMIKAGLGIGFISNLPLGVAAPLREAARTCQLSPPAEWPVSAYKLIGRNDLAAGASSSPDILFNDGYKTAKDYIVRCCAHSYHILAHMCSAYRIRPLEEASAIFYHKLPLLAQVKSKRFQEWNLILRVLLRFGLAKIADLKKSLGCFVRQVYHL